MSAVYESFRRAPTPSGAVALARANFWAAHRNSDSQYLEQLQIAERQCDVHAELVAALRQCCEAFDSPAAHQQKAYAAARAALAKVQP
jgi:exonuclease VII large subunit